MRMEFLPLEIDGSKVYAGFWKRAGAGVIDTIALIPVVFLVVFWSAPSIEFAAVLIALSTAIFPAYSVFFHYRYGATPGKLVFDVRVTNPDGTRISLKQAFLRSSVDCVYSVLTAIAEIIAVYKVNPIEYLALNGLDQYALLQGYIPFWHVYVLAGSNVWVWSECFVLLLNKRRRALHDFIAGTVVIHKEHVVTESGPLQHVSEGL